MGNGSRDLFKFLLVSRLVEARNRRKLKTGFYETSHNISINLFANRFSVSCEGHNIDSALCTLRLSPHSHE